MKTFPNEADYLQISWCCKVIMILVWNHHFANSTVVIMTLFAITNYHWPICLVICFIQFVRLSYPYTGHDDGLSRIPNFDWGRTAGVTGQQRMLTHPWHLILPSHLSEVHVALYSIWNCLLDYDYVLHIVNFAILYCPLGGISVSHFISLCL